MKEFTINSKLMGSAFQLAVVKDKESDAIELLHMGIKKIEQLELLLSEFLPDSATSQLNQHAHKIATNVNDECFNLIERSLAISNLTNGCFDITVSPLKKIYNFKNKQFNMPSQREITAALASVGYGKIEIDPQQRNVRFNHSNLKISFAAIGKGYASDEVKKIWIKEGVTSGYINASGDLNAFGKKADESQWEIGISDPNQPSNILLHIPIDNASVATSGDYEQFFINNGTRYSHNINPHTGIPLTGIKSVSVFSPSAELSDALATAVYVMGSKDGIDFINQLPQTHAVIINEKNELFFSKNLNYEKTAL